ncbi:MULTISPECIES: hypothetical protein [unclassified Coleofasciculus]|uniref:hypothetical protein n=1 Tax=unclassified Coleofasciculus TaxID=2692782 RepID=UPI0018806240|nr:MULTISPECIES: hypothetical protein [unclassified Coleofasciculus]MBE9127697.1 hypothetical protein [Coleofasciculus sp. LEGE 07081]MBE9151035.1 hypothetical protein [Coleofasciculus sp. LEGE 07092]
MMLDFDEILVNVKNPQVKKYLEESIKSYRVGNYRSAILAVWIATMFDLVKKFEILVDQRESTAISKWNNLKPKIEDHKNWEMELIHAAKAVAMISRYEADTLEALSKTRNRYAHPSFDDVGTLFDPTPEEVRYFIRTLYDIVLSQPAQLGAFYVNQLLEAIKSPTFFSTRLFADELVSAKNDVSEKISRINQKQIPRLIKELFQALNSPSSSEHELNILCFVINLWGTQAELQLPIEISAYWDDYISDKGLSIRALEAILNYPECLNELSERSQQAIDTFLRPEFLDFLMLGISRKFFQKFLAYADIVPLAKFLLDDVLNEISINEAMQRSGHFEDVLGDKYGEIFGQAIFNETRQILLTCDGYKVNPALSALRKCGIWKIASTLSLTEQESFANELINSLNSNNWETMDLLKFNNRQDIPIKLIKLMLEQWSDKIQTDSLIKINYLEHYLALVERYTTELGTYVRLEEVLKILIAIIKDNPDALERISKLSSNESLWTFWRKLLTEYREVIVSTPLEEMI